MVRQASESELVDNAPLAGIGHNSIAGKELLKIIEHVESLMDQRRELSDSIRDAMDTAKVRGYDRRTIREVIKLRALDAETRNERRDLLDLYLVAVGLA